MRDDGLEGLPPQSDDPTQAAVREWFVSLGQGAWLPLLASTDHVSGHLGIFCALSPPSRRTDALRDPGWDLLRGGQGPGFSGSPEEAGGWATTYHRFGSEPIEPLVIDRNFHGIQPAYTELSEEFRLYHNLYAEAGGAKLSRIDDAGVSQLAAIVEPDRVIVQTSLVRRYQAARQLDLLLFIDSAVFFEDPTQTPPDEEWLDGEQNITRFAGASGERRFTHLLGTRVLSPPPIERAGIWPYEAEDKDFPEFIIGTDEMGDPIRHSCDPDRLANYFGANPGAPHYLTPVAFRRDVLVKYYDRPDLYIVEDGYLRCGGLWGLQLDNDADGDVVVFLGDLGRDLPAAERNYWLSFNIPPSRPLSDSAFRRSILGEFAGPGSTDHRLRSALAELREAWPARYGWALFRDLEAGDAHLADQIRTPLHDSEAEFEDLVRTLAKLLVDGLNERELVRDLPPGPSDEKGIGKLERWLRSVGYTSINADISFLRNLQAVRSKVVAHLKGSDYEKALDRAVGAKRQAAAANVLLDQALAFVENLLALARAPDEGTVPGTTHTAEDGGAE